MIGHHRHWCNVTRLVEFRELPQFMAILVSKRTRTHTHTHTHTHKHTHKTSYGNIWSQVSSFCDDNSNYDRFCDFSPVSDTVDDDQGEPS